MLPTVIGRINYYRSPLGWDQTLGQRNSLRFAELCAGINEQLPVKALRTMRWPRLKRLLVHAYRSVPLYRKRFTAFGIDPGDLQSEAEFWKLPLVAKGDFRHYAPDRYLAQELPVWRRKPGFTSGSTGEPFRYVRDLGYRLEQQALARRVWNWAGADVLAKKIHCSSTTRHVWPNMISLHPHSIQAKKQEYIEIIRRSGAELLYGFSLTVFELLWMLAEGRMTDVRFQKAILTGHTTAPGIRAFIQNHFNCEVFTYYAAVELGIIAIECEAHNGLHIQEENMIVEVADANGMPVPDGTVGEIIITSLSNEVMPFIRYDTGDLGALMPGRCPCGRTSRRLIVEGRSNEYLFVGPHGESICPGILRDVLDGYFDYFHRYQMVQEDLGVFMLNIVPTEHYTSDLNTRLIAEIQKASGYPILVRVKTVDVIPPLPSGKFQYFVSNFWPRKFPAGMVVAPSLRAGTSVINHAQLPETIHTSS